MNHIVYLVNVSRLTNQIQLPLAFAVLTNTLKMHNIDTVLIDMIPVEKEKREDFFRVQLPKEPAIYGFSIIAGNSHIDETEKYAKMVMTANSNNVIVYGGPLPSAVPELLLKNCLCRYIISGEAEFSFPMLIKSLFEGNYYPEGISGLFYKKDGTVIGVKNKRVRQLDRYSAPDYSLFDMDYYIRYLEETGQSFEIMASRGCRGNCSFCFKVCGPGLSTRSVDSVLDEIEALIGNYGINRFYFVDENFFEVKKYFHEFIKRKNERNLEFTFIVQSRIDTIERELCIMGRENGLTFIGTGVESASQETLDRINKRITVEQIEGKIRLMRELGIRVSVNLMMGFPWEKAEDYEELLAFIKRNQLEKCSKVSYLTPLPATKLYQEAKEKGYIKDDFEYIRQLGDLYWERMVNLTSMPDEVLDYYYKKVSNVGQKDVVYPDSPDYMRQIKKLH